MILLLLPHPNWNLNDETIFDDTNSENMGENT